ncbi:hypothetical protein PWT90_06421 [Aphanocladium album]|nr:hypothetical protein PWT90_06421 [Aphanocladium album]
MALAPFRDINRRLAGRSIRVMISPTPSTFTERRLILQVLKKYGHIDVFRRENYQANRYITITRSEDTARALTQLSPIACRISLPHIDPATRARQFQSHTESSAQPRIEFKTQTAQSPSKDEQLQGAAEPEGDFETREFVLSIGPARDYDHGNAATKATEFSSWPEAYKSDKSFMTTTLREALPDTLLKKGLCHWNVRPVPEGPRDSMQQRLERKQQIPGQMVAANTMKAPAHNRTRRPSRETHKTTWGKRQPNETDSLATGEQEVGSWRKDHENVATALKHQHCPCKAAEQPPHLGDLQLPVYSE